MQKLPRLRIMKPGSEEELIQDFEFAMKFPYNKGQIITVENHLVSSYPEFLKFITENQMMDKEYLNVRLMPIFFGG